MSNNYMLRAIELSRQHMKAGNGGPFGAVIVKDDKIIAEGWNRVTTYMDPTAHAEVTAIRDACKVLNRFNLSGCEIYTSCEPCPMCLAAIYWARIEKIYYANTRGDAAQIEFDDDFLYQELNLPIKQRKIPMIQVNHKEALAVFREWALKVDKMTY
jgi:guanine deaminase